MLIIGQQQWIWGGYQKKNFEIWIPCKFVKYFLIAWNLNFGWLNWLLEDSCLFSINHDYCVDNNIHVGLFSIIFTLCIFIYKCIRHFYNSRHPKLWGLSLRVLGVGLTAVSRSLNNIYYSSLYYYVKLIIFRFFHAL